jgi:tryptophan synthase alpha chain
VGFGIRDAQTAKSIAAISDAVVIGSRLVQEIESSDPDQVIANVSTLLGGIRRAMDGA